MAGDQPVPGHMCAGNTCRKVKAGRTQVRVSGWLPGNLGPPSRRHARRQHGWTGYPPSNPPPTDLRRSRKRMHFHRAAIPRLGACYRQCISGVWDRPGSWGQSWPPFPTCSLRAGATSALDYCWRLELLPGGTCLVRLSQHDQRAIGGPRSSNNHPRFGN